MGLVRRPVCFAVSGFMLGLSLVVVRSLAALPTGYQDPIPPPHQIAAPHQAIAQLGVEVARLVDARILNRGQGKSLSIKLEHAEDALMVGDPDAVLRPMNAFDREVAGLRTAQVIGDKDGLVLTDLANQAITGLRSAHQVPFVEPLSNPCLNTGPCKPVALHVDRDASPDGDGSSDSPYGSIAEALAAAAELQACGVEIVLHPGRYHGSIELTRDTWLRNAGSARPVIQGSVLNQGGYRLSVSGIAFENSPAPGAIVVDGPCSPSTEISNVEIRNAGIYGVFQRRGALRAIGLNVRGTAPDPADADTGRAIRLVDGVQAAIGLADLSFNVGGGLSISGPHTHVFMGLSNIGHNDVHPRQLSSPPAFLGSGVEVGDRALLLAEFTAMVGNEGIALLVKDAARAHFRYGRVEHTGDVAVPGEGDLYGINMLALDGGVLQLSYFRSSYADLVGYYVFRGYGRAKQGLVANNVIGAAVFELPADFSVDTFVACIEDVRFLHNTSNFSGDFLPVPCGSSCPVCPVSVPFVCTWCG